MNAFADPVQSATGALSVHLLQPSDHGRWDAFVAACPEATFFHKAGWQTIIELVNTSSSAAQANVQLTGDDGSPLTLPLTSPDLALPASASPVNAPLPPFGTALIQRVNAPDPAVQAGPAVRPPPAPGRPPAHAPPRPMS